MFIFSEVCFFNPEVGSTCRVSESLHVDKSASTSAELTYCVIENKPKCN